MGFLLVLGERACFSALKVSWNDGARRLGGGFPFVGCCSKRSSLRTPSWKSAQECGLCPLATLPRYVAINKACSSSWCLLFE